MTTWQTDKATLAARVGVTDAVGILTIETWGLPQLLDALCDAAYAAGLTAYDAALAEVKYQTALAIANGYAVVALRAELAALRERRR